MRLNARWRLTQRLARLRGHHPESVIQDADIPFDQAGAFLDFLRREIGIPPIWVYSDSTFTREEFAAAYDMDAYAALKRKYDPQGLLLGLY